MQHGDEAQPQHRPDDAGGAPGDLAPLGVPGPAGG